MATSEAQHGVHWAVVGVDQPGVLRSYRPGATRSGLLLHDAWDSKRTPVDRLGAPGTWPVGRDCTERAAATSVGSLHGQAGSRDSGTSWEQREVEICQAAERGQEPATIWLAMSGLRGYRLPAGRCQRQVAVR